MEQMSPSGQHRPFLGVSAACKTRGLPHAPLRASRVS